MEKKHQCETGNVVGLLFWKKKCIKAGFQRVQRRFLLERMGKVIACSAREEMWWVYCFGKRNVLRLDFKESREDFSWERSFHVVRERKRGGSIALKKEMYQVWISQHPERVSVGEDGEGHSMYRGQKWKRHQDQQWNVIFMWLSFLYSCFCASHSCHKHSNTTLKAPPPPPRKRLKSTNHTRVKKTSFLSNDPINLESFGGSPCSNTD